MEMHSRIGAYLDLSSASVRLIPASELCHGVNCPSCLRRRIDLQQPDLEDPDRLLGICPRCRAWCLLEAGGETVRITPLPGRGRDSVG